jgi:purine nucleosidase
VALDPTIVTRKGSYFVDVETSSDITRGQTVVDELGVLELPTNMTVIHAIDVARWKAMLHQCVR